MSTSTTHQQSLADAGSETRPPMLERGSYIPCASCFRRYLNRKRENRKWLNKAIDEGPYKFKEFTPSESKPPRMQKKEDLKGDDLKHYEADIEAMKNGIIFPKVTVNTKFLNYLQPEWLKYVTQVCLARRLTKDTYDDLFDHLQQFEKLDNASRVKKLEKSHDPLVLVAYTGSSSRTVSPYYVILPSLVVDYDDDYQGDAVQNISEDPLTSAMILLARAIIQRFSNPTNNYLRTFSNARNQAIVQADKVNIQSRNSGSDGRYIRRSYVQEEVIEGNNFQNDVGNIQRSLRTMSSGTAANVQCYNCSEKGHYACNCPKPRVRDSKYFMEQMLLAKQDEARVILTDEQNEFLFADASRMEEIEELSANICLMSRIQPVNFDSDEGPSYDFAFLSEVQIPSTSYVNPLFAKDKQEQNGSVEYDNNFQELYELEQLARNAFKEAEKQQIIAKKVQQQNTVLTKQLESYKEKVQNPKLYDASCLDDSKIHVNVRDTEDILDEATKSQIKMKKKSQDPIAIEKKQNIWTIDYKKLNALYEDFVPQKELSAKQKYFSSSFISFENSSNESSPSSSSETKPTVASLPNIKEIKDVFDSTKNDLSETLTQNELLKDQFLEAKLKHEIECCVLLSHECVNNNVQVKVEKIQRDSIEIQEGVRKRINTLENDVQRFQKQSLDFELQLHHEKKRQKCESSLKKVCETSWISKMEKLESENVSLEFEVQSLIKERENVKSEYQKL
ncbi:retrovirus-related pol polyprotein from transposon TNT 1-94 [Tanacetum coccineum]